MMNTDYCHLLVWRYLVMCSSTNVHLYNIELLSTLSHPWIRHIGHHCWKWKFYLWLETVVLYVWTLLKSHCIERNQEAVKGAKSLKKKLCSSFKSSQWLKCHFKILFGCAHRKGFWLCWSGSPSVDVVDRGSSGCGRSPGTSGGTCADCVKVEGRELGWMLAAMGREALNGRDEGTGDVELGCIWLSVKRGGSCWNGLEANGASIPDKNGLKFLEGGLEGIKASRLTSDAPVGPRNASGVLLVWGAVFGRPSPREDISKGIWPFKFAWPPSIASSKRSSSKNMNKSNEINECTLPLKSLGNVQFFMYF